MSYRVAKTNNNGRWRLLYEAWSNNTRKDMHIPAAQYPQIGLRESMSIEEARARIKQVNAQQRLKKREEAKKLRTYARVRDDALAKCAFLPAAECEEFEKEVLIRRLARGDAESAKFRKVVSHWNYVTKMIATVQLDPSDWAEQPEVFYNYFEDQETSPEYVSKILRALNLWGHFICKQHGKPFLAVPPPTGYERERIAEAYFDSENYVGASAPLTPTLLEKAQPNLSIPGHYEWLYCSVWLGLRPSEIDALARPDSWRVKTDDAGVTILEVYQSKLRSVPRDQRWKPIPLIYSEQRRALKFIQEGRCKRPLTKTVRRCVSDRVSLYGGRKGFTDLMLSLGQELTDISVWMGHTTIERTWRSYKSKNIVRYRRPKNDSKPVP